MCTFVHRYYGFVVKTKVTKKVETHARDSTLIRISLKKFYRTAIKVNIIMASQLPVENWYDAIGDQAVADAVLDRIVHSSHRIELTGESIRKMKARK